jgi:holo-[acyl-carrier protein] synthase
MEVSLPPGGVLIGLGCDVIEVARVQGAAERQGERFLSRVFTEEERAYCQAMPHPYRHFAARFAAKEAVSKCFTTGIGAALGWRSVSVRRGARGEPIAVLDEKGRALLGQVGATGVLVTLSHTGTHAMAVAALVRRS